MSDDNDGQMIFGELGGRKLPDICLTGEEKPRKNSPRKLVPTGDRTRARCLTGAQAAAWPTAVDELIIVLHFILEDNYLAYVIIHLCLQRSIKVYFFILGL